ncbi:unnamed protein product [Boreogadus saida]
MATRIEQLAVHKASLLRSPDRRSPVWRVSEGALRACASQRVCALAQPRPPAVGWLPDRPPPPSVRVKGGAPLSQPRLRPRVGATDGGPRLRPRVEATDGGPRLRPRVEAGQGFRTPPIARKMAAATPRVEQLATPKRTPPGYLCGRPSSWPVPGSVRRAVPSLRVRELASPRQREALFQGYDPYAISAGALLAKPSPRLQELALPLPRKCRSE